MNEYEDYVCCGGAMVNVEGDEVHEFVLSIRSTFNEVHSFLQKYFEVRVMHAFYFFYII